MIPRAGRCAPDGRARQTQTAGPRETQAAPSKRDVNYRQLRNPFPVMSVFSDDEAANMHETALRMLEELGMKVLLPEARDIFAAGGRAGDRRRDGPYRARHGGGGAEDRAEIHPLPRRGRAPGRDAGTGRAGVPARGRGAPCHRSAPRPPPGLGSDFRDYTGWRIISTSSR
jgi:hypothetical protein